MISDFLLQNYANQLREETQSNLEEPINDIVEVLKKAGYHFQEASFGNEFSGYSKFLGNFDFLIGFNTDHNWSEKFKRFTIAHELGHVTIPKHIEILKKEILHRSKPEFISEQVIEKEADKFAISFLAPTSGFRKEIKKKAVSFDTIKELSEFYNISIYATTLRFVSLTAHSCALVVCNNKGIIEYEIRSNKLKQTLTHELINKSKVSKNNLVYDFINGDKEYDKTENFLREWYPNLPKDVEINESIFYQSYNQKYLVLIEPHVSDLTEYFYSVDY